MSDNLDSIAIDHNDIGIGGAMIAIDTITIPSSTVTISNGPIASDYIITSDYSYSIPTEYIGTYSPVSLDLLRKDNKIEQLENKVKNLEKKIELIEATNEKILNMLLDSGNVSVSI